MTAERRRDEVDLDFAAYVSRRRGLAEQRARDGAAYAYAGERRVVRTLQLARPVTLAIEATVRLWKTVARADLLGSAVKVTDQQFPRLYAITARSAEVLHIPVPSVYVTAGAALNAHTLGTETDAYIVLNSQLVDHLDDRELTFVIGHECGHIQNNHVVLTTALYYLTVAASFYVRWIVQPAVLALKAWARRAEITCDRAGLLCVRDLDVATAAIVKLGLGSLKLYQELDIQEYLKQLDDGRRGLGRMAELFRSHPYLPKRLEALRVFARSDFYQAWIGGPRSGLPADECDAEVGKILSVF
jgi:Zn-dependent protease with chaperone function